MGGLQLADAGARADPIAAQHIVADSGRSSDDAQQPTAPAATPGRLDEHARPESASSVTAAAGPSGSTPCPALPAATGEIAHGKRALDKAHLDHDSAYLTTKNPSRLCRALGVAEQVVGEGGFNDADWKDTVDDDHRRLQADAQATQRRPSWGARRLSAGIHPLARVRR